MDQQLLTRILRLYGLETALVGAVEKGYRNESRALSLPSGQILNLILYKREPGMRQRITNANRVADFLAAQGFPARTTYDPRILRLAATNYEQFAALYEYLSGATIPWEAYTMLHIKRLGKTMSDMHALLQPLAKEQLPSVIEQSQKLVERMQTYFAEDGVQTALLQKLHLKILPLPFDFAPYDQLAKSQALHMDFVRGNILFDDDHNITGVLDFEKAAWGPPLFDIARTLAFLLVDCKYKQEAKIRKYFLHSGYNKRGAANFSDWQLLEPLVNFFLLHDFYKFLRHNPYEYLDQNEHFTRTRDFLLNRNILAQTKMLQ